MHTGGSNHSLLLMLWHTVPQNGNARRMVGTAKQTKYEVLREAVANHGPKVKLPPAWLHEQA